jgi:hypothetical protein
MNNNNKIEAKENLSKGEIIHSYCNKCGKIMNHQILMDYCESGIDILDSEFDFSRGKIDYTADFKNDYQIIKCSGCDTISYRSFYFFSEYQNFDNDGTWEERYPVLKRKIEKDFQHLPFTLTRIYKEVIMAYNNNCLILCVAGIRAILEGICKDKGITEGKLDKKIKSMCEQGFVSLQHESILHKLRFLGNEVLHELQTPSQEEIDAALDIIEHIIESLYEILGKAELIKQEKA